MNRPAFAAFAAFCASTLSVAGIGGHAALEARSAQAQPPGKLDPARVTAGTYAVDPAHTLVGWRVSHWAISDYFGIFGDVKGTLALDPRNLGATRLDVTIPVTSVTVASAGLRDHLLRPGKDGGKPDFFGASPADARFVSTALRRTGARTANITGNLTLNGVTRPITIAAEFTGAGPHPGNGRLNIGFKGRAAINRSDFGIGFGIPSVSDRVEFDISAAFEKSAAATQISEPSRCKANAAGDAIGRRDTPALRAEVARKVGHSRIRWLPPGSIVTQDLRSDRLNIDIDEGGVVVRVRCG